MLHCYCSNVLFFEVLNGYVFDFLVFSLRLCEASFRAAVKLHLYCTFGGSFPHIRCDDTANFAAADTRERGAALVASAEPAAMQKCQFGGLLPHIRPPFQRKYCNLCNKCNSYHFQVMSLFFPLPCLRGRVGVGVPNKRARTFLPSLFLETCSLPLATYVIGTIWMIVTPPPPSLGMASVTLLTSG